MSATDMSGQEEEEEDNDNCSSVCSINSEELERDMLPDPSEEHASSHSSAAGRGHEGHEPGAPPQHYARWLPNASLGGESPREQRWRSGAILRK